MCLWFWHQVKEEGIKEPWWNYYVQNSESCLTGGWRKLYIWYFYQTSFIFPVYCRSNIKTLRFSAEKSYIHKADKQRDGTTNLKSATAKARGWRYLPVGRVLWGIGCLQKVNWRLKKGEVIVVLWKHKDAMCSLMGGMFIKWLCGRVLRVEFLTQFSSVQFSPSVVSDSLQPHEFQHARLSCPSPTPGVHPNPRPSSWWCHPAISSSVISFSGSASAES